MSIRAKFLIDPKDAPRPLLLIVVERFGRIVDRSFPIWLGRRREA